MIFTTNWFPGRSCPIYKLFSSEWAIISHFTKLHHERPPRTLSLNQASSGLVCVPFWRTLKYALQNLKGLPFWAEEDQTNCSLGCTYLSSASQIKESQVRKVATFEHFGLEQPYNMMVVNSLSPKCLWKVDWSCLEHSNNQVKQLKNSHTLRMLFNVLKKPILVCKDNYLYNYLLITVIILKDIML